jgi:hypothetical protein
MLERNNTLIHLPSTTVSEESLEFGEVIQKYRKKAQLNQPDLAEMLGVSRNTVTNWETGKNKPDIDLTIKLCQLLGIPANELLGTPSETVHPGAEQRILENYRKLSTVNQKIAESIIKTMVDEEALARDNLMRDSFKLIEMPQTSVAAGSGCESNGEPPKYCFVKKNARNEHADAIVRVSGKSMEPLYRDGDQIYIMYTENAEDGKNVVCATSDGNVVKHLSGRKLYSLNPEYPYGEKTEDFTAKIIGIALDVVLPDDIAVSDDESILNELLHNQVRDFKLKYGLD